jgi:hypothetical protein
MTTSLPSSPEPQRSTFFAEGLKGVPMDTDMGNIKTPA